MKNFLSGSLFEERHGLSEIPNCKNFFSATYVNGDTEKISPCRGEQLLIVLTGEADIAGPDFPVRMTAGSWLNFPSGQEANISVYRSSVPVNIILFKTDSICEKHEYIFGNFFELPRWQKSTESLFAFECNHISGAFQVLKAHQSISADAGDFIFCLEGELEYVEKIFGKNHWILPKNSIEDIKCNKDCVIIKLSPGSSSSASHYKNWLFEEFGILWDQGVHHC